MISSRRLFWNGVLAGNLFFVGLAELFPINLPRWWWFAGVVWGIIGFLMYGITRTEVKP